MSLLRSPLLPLVLLALTVACSGKRSTPEPGEPGPIQTAVGGAGGAGGGGAGTGGATNGGGGAGGMMSTSTSTSTATGMGGNTLNVPDDMAPYCGCIEDMRQPGACGTCTDLADDVGAACEAYTTAAACDAGCQAVIAFLLADGACATPDAACLQAAFVQTSATQAEFDDAVAYFDCVCGACAAPVCDGTACAAAMP